MTLPDAETLLHQLADKLRPVIDENTALVGIHSGGAWITERLIPLLQDKLPGIELAHGMLDISFYRDDFSRIGLHSQIKPSQISFEVEGKHIILIDDVLYTGRTIRAAMNELFDYGRPASIRLAVLVDRGERELPIAAQFSAVEVALGKTQNLQLLRHADGHFYLRLEENASC